MTIPPNSAYFVLTIPFLVIWFLLYLFSKKTRREQLDMSILLLPLGTLSELFYFKDYWKPLSILSYQLGPLPIYLEDFLFSFAIGGISAIIYEVLFHRTFHKMKKKIRYPMSVFMISFVAGFCLITLITLGINSIYASSIAFMLAAFLVVIQRKDLLLDSFGSGFGVMITMFIGYSSLYYLVQNNEQIMHQQWLIYGTPLDIRVYNIPLTEMIWGFTWGMVAGPIYAFRKGLRVS